MLFFSDLLQNFAVLDLDKDGLLSPHEFSRFFTDDSGDAFNSLDVDHNGKLSEEELHSVMDHLQLGKGKGGVDKNWQDDQQKSDKMDMYNSSKGDDFDQYIGEDNGGVGKSKKNDQQKMDLYDSDDPEDEDSPTDKDGPFNWQDYV